MLKKINIGQDWATVISSFLILLLVLVAGYDIKAPSFGPKAGISDIDALFSAMTVTSLGISLIATFAVCLIIFIIRQTVINSCTKLSGSSICQRPVSGFCSI